MLGSAAQTAAQAEQEAAQVERRTLDAQRATAHGLVGALTAALGGTSPTSGFIGGAAGKLATLELARLIDESAALPLYDKGNPPTN